MAVDATLMFREVDLVRQQGQSASHFRIDCQILCAGVWISPYRFEFFGNERDYVNGWGDALVIQFMLGLGTYTYKLLANRDNLIVDLKYVPLMEAGGEQRADMRAKSVRYRAIMLNQNNQAVTGKLAQATNEEMLNRGSPMTVQMQLITEANYRINMMTTGRLYKRMSPADVIKMVLTERLADTGGNNDERLLGINFADGHNTEKRNVIPVPHGTPLIKLAHWMQEQEGGVYPSGLGCFIQNQYWWIYSLYDVANLNKKLKTLTVYNVPRDRLDGAERTYRLTDNQVIVLATGDASALDPSLFDKLNLGNGVRFPDARKLLSTFGVSKENRLLFDRATNLFEVVGKKLDTAFNNVGWAPGGATSNPFKHYSELASRNGQIVEVNWKHGDIDVLEPGMGVEFFTTYEDKLRAYRGILHGAHEQRVPAEPGAVASRHPSMVTLKLFISRTETDAQA